VRLRERAKADEQGAGIGVTAIVARALVIALGEFPSMNALALEDGLHLAGNITLGIAADTPEGLVVPVIRGAQSFTLPQMHTAIRAIKEAAAQHRLGPDDFAGGTFTLSNLEHLPVRSFAPILNAPQVGIMGIADVQERVVVIEHQKEKGWGRIINISSTAATGGLYRQPGYAASKAGLLGLTRTVALEFSPYGITCKADLPGLIETEKVGELPPDIREAAIERIPAGRTGKPEEVAALVAFLASPLASYINGAAIPIDGGAVLNQVSLARTSHSRKYQAG
jgi:hypothetical protein